MFWSFCHCAFAGSLFVVVGTTQRPTGTRCSSGGIQAIAGGGVERKYSYCYQEQVRKVELQLTGRLNYEKDIPSVTQLQVFPAVAQSAR